MNINLKFKELDIATQYISSLPKLHATPDNIEFVVMIVEQIHESLSELFYLILHNDNDRQKRQFARYSPPKLIDVRDRFAATKNSLPYILGLLAYQFL
jgi:hypothetical protein